MPANFTRRRDLFLDAGFGDPDPVISQLTSELSNLASSASWVNASAVRDALRPRLELVPKDQRRLAQLVPEWVGARSGDLATALWLAQAVYGSSLDLTGYVLAILDALLASGRERDARAYARFMLDLHFDWSQVYADRNIAYQFLQTRDPNPLVWKLLEYFRDRGIRLRILELGCGVGNDAAGFLTSPEVESYVGVDISDQALQQFSQRAEELAWRVKPLLVRTDFSQMLQRPPEQARPFNLVYSYSSLHYFSSGELSRIFQLVRQLLVQNKPEPGFFAFGIKGAGSVWDGQGLPLYQTDVWINWDGQSRWFPSRTALSRQLDREGFETRFHDLADHWSYSEVGKRDVFHYVLCSPRG